MDRRPANGASTLCSTETASGYSFRRNSKSTLHWATVSERKATTTALAIPEILECILSHLDSYNEVPHEPPPLRRKPLSLRHARLIYATEEKAREVWDAVVREDAEVVASAAKRATAPAPTNKSNPSSSRIYQCLFVSKEWNQAAQRVLRKRIHFSSYDRWTSFVQGSYAQASPWTKVFVLHKLASTTQPDLDQVSQNISGRIEWLELYTCSALLPPATLLRGGRIRKLILPGCVRADDEFLIMVANAAPLLQTLDLRACDRVSDVGILAIADQCSQLRMLNIGRTSGADRITSLSISAIAEKTQVDTLGLAGTNVCDEAMWQVAKCRGALIERLSLNNCSMLTNASIPRILQYTPNLTVLELRGCRQITHVRPIFEFKHMQERRRRPLLMEGCEVFETRMREEEYKMAVELWYRSRDDVRIWLEKTDLDTEMTDA